MLLTFCYMTATWIQSWKLRSVCSIITKKMIEKSSVVFYKLPNNSNDIEINITPVSSELCTNYSQARIIDHLWHEKNQRGCTISPIQKVLMTPWISFPMSSNLIPFSYQNILHNLDEKMPVHLLLETDIFLPINLNSNISMVEHFGELIAWKVDSHLSILLKSDLTHFCELVHTTFMQDQCYINDGLFLLRIQSVTIDGIPQPFELIKNHAGKNCMDKPNGESLDVWSKYLDGLRSMSVLANQATEYEYNKNRTEGKTGVVTVKPDLIVSNTIENTLIDSKSVSPKKISFEVQKQEKKKSPIKIVPSDFKKETIIVITESPIHNNKSPEKLKQDIKVKVKELPNKIISPEKEKTIFETRKVEPNNVKKEPIIIIDSPDSDCKNKPLIKVLSPVKIENDIKTAVSILISPTKEENIIEVKIEEPPPNETISNEKSLEKLQNNDIKECTVDSVPTSSTPIEDKSTVIIHADTSKRPKLKRTKGSSITCKPPNVLVYSESVVTRENVISTLRSVLESDKYTIYPLTHSQIDAKIWIENATLLVVCGTVNLGIGKILLEFFLKGGKMFCLCSDLLHVVLPTYRTAEVRENELVRFSYGKWQKVKMMHHIFCYQPSPVKKHFSHDSDEIITVTNKPILLCPRSIEVNDLQGNQHNLQVQVLGIEETWNTPSLMLASNNKSGGKAIFSQVHLETDPTQYECDETKFSVLQQNEVARFEILADILSKYLEINTKVDKKLIKQYTNGFFLGRHESKFDLLKKLKPKMPNGNIIENDKMTIQFCGKGEQPTNNATEIFLPILIHSCPDDFSTVDYFDNLKSVTIGRMLIYTPVLSSSMDVLSNLTLSHGIAVIPRHQTNGTGRNQNQWLSPDGCLMFSLQLHIPLSSNLGQRLSLVQHLVAIAVVNSLLNSDGCKDLDIGIKWPNDIYANGTTKIGGLIINSQIDAEQAICNIGCGLNLNNSNPTVCVNDLINEFNLANNTNITIPIYEKVLANIFTEIENLYELVQNSNIECLYDMYYKVWIHGNSEVTIMDKKGLQKSAQIIGIDDNGYLLVQRSGQKTETVHPDMIRGLILPK